MVRNYKRETEKGNTDIPNLVKESTYHILPMSHHLLTSVCSFPYFPFFNPCMDVLLDDKLCKHHQLLYTVSPMTPCIPLESPDNVITASVALLQP